MKDDFLGTLLGNASRARLLRVFMLNQSELFTLPLAAKRAGVSVKSAEKELRVLEEAGIVKKGRFVITLGNGSGRVVQGKQKEQTWMANPGFKYASALSKFIHEISPVSHDSVVEALRSSGRLAVVILSGHFLGDATRPADLIVAGDSINERRLLHAIRGLEPSLGREIRYASFTTPELRYRLTVQDRLIRDTLDYPHIVLLDRTKLL